MIARRDFDRIADGFRYVANDPAADAATVQKMFHEFTNAASALNPRFDLDGFRVAVFGEPRQVRNPWNGEFISCKKCGGETFYDRGRSLDYFNHECFECGTINHTMTETGMSA